MKKIIALGLALTFSSVCLLNAQTAADAKKQTNETTTVEQKKSGTAASCCDKKGQNMRKCDEKSKVENTKNCHQADSKQAQCQKTCANKDAAACKNKHEDGKKCCKSDQKDGKKACSEKKECKKECKKAKQDQELRN